MSLVISKSEEIFYLNGVLNTSTLKYFKQYFNNNLIQNYNLILNIENLSEFDTEGLLSIKDLARVSLLNKNIFSIICRECEQICDRFNQV